MTEHAGSIRSVPAVDASVRRVGCVSFLNAKPLIEGLDNRPDAVVKYDVPSQLLPALSSGEVDVALCPVIDFQRSATPLSLVPVGGIGCDGTTLTVRLYSRSPLEEIAEVHADTDSHTSVTLLRILLSKVHGVRPKIIDYHAREHVADGRPIAWPQAMLLIGDKVVTDSPPAVRYPHQMDLGHAWKQLTGLPFVFAVWMSRTGDALGDLPTLLRETRERNQFRIDQIVDRYADAHGWPRDLAKQYLGRWLKFDVGERQMQAIQTFWQMAHEVGAIDVCRPMHVYSQTEH